MTDEERSEILRQWNKTSARLRSLGDTTVPGPDHEDPMPYSSREMRGNGPMSYQPPRGNR